MEAAPSIGARQYQEDHIASIAQAFTRNRVVLAQLPTGGGKTVEFSMIVKRWTEKQSSSVLILVHRIELLHQAKETIRKMYGINAQLIIAGTNKVIPSPVYVGMVESVFTRAEFLHRLNLGLIIIDEAHIGNFSKMHQIFTEERILGVTATPISTSKKEPLNKYYGEIVIGPSIRKLIDLGFLSQNITRCPEDVVSESLLKIDAKTGDFDMRQMASEFSKPKYVANTMLFYNKWCRNTKTIVFNVNVEHSLEVTNMFKICGFNAKHLDGETPMDERVEILKWYKETPDAILCNVGIAGIGFDEPTIENVIANLSTLSLGKWIQLAGRGGRIIDDRFIENFQSQYPYPLRRKNKFNIIDLGGNGLRFGDWSDERDWKAIFDMPEKVGKPGNAPTKTCPNCSGLVHAAVIVCPLLLEDGEPCLHIFDREKHEREESLGELIIITKDLSLDLLVQEYPNNLPYYYFFEMGRKSAKQIAEKLHKRKMRLTQADVKALFDIYMIKTEEWFKKTKPNGDLTYEQHKHWLNKTGRTHFELELKRNRVNISI